MKPFSKWQKPLTSMRDKTAWLVKNRAMWEYAPDEILNDRWSVTSQALIEKARADGLYRPTTVDWDIWYLLKRKIKALKKKRVAGRGKF